MAVQRLTLEEARAHNGRSPVFRIADELLELIFLEVVSAGYITTATMAAMELAGVCSRWCIVVLNHGRLWSRLSTFHPVLFRMSLSRSLSASLSLKLDVCDVQTANLALEEIHRVVDLDVSVFPVLAVVAAGEKTAPALRTLSLQFDHACKSPLLEGWSMPILEKLSLAHTSLRSHGHLLLETLTTLELMNVDCCDATGMSGSSLSFQSFGRLRALKSLRLIRCLSRTLSRASMGPVRVRLPALETLSVVDLPGPILPFLQHIDIPANASRSLSFDSCLPRNDLVRNLADWFCHSFFRRSVADVQFRTSVQIVNPEPNREFGSRFVFGSCSPVSVRFAVQPYNLRFELVRTDYSISARFVGFSVMWNKLRKPTTH